MFVIAFTVIEFEWCHYFIANDIFYYWITIIIYRYTYFNFSFCNIFYHNDDCFSDNLKTYFDFIQMYWFNLYILFHGTDWINNSEYELNILFILGNSTDVCITGIHLFTLASVQSSNSYNSSYRYYTILDYYHRSQTINNMDNQEST